MASNNFQQNQVDPPGPCPVIPVPLTPFTNANTPTVAGPTISRIKIPVVLAEPTIQIAMEAVIPTPGATEIKRVKKNVFLDQVKLVPVAPFTRIDGTDFFTFQRAKLFIAGHVRKNIEYATAACNAPLQDQIVDISFTGFTELSVAAGTLINQPIFGISETAEANFLNENTSLDARLDKFFFQNLVKFNEQPFGELVAANFFELDFTPTPTTEGTVFNTVTEKLVLDLTVKVLQLQQIHGTFTTLVPVITGLTPPTA
jgi:hypothetical protein